MLARYYEDDSFRAKSANVDPMMTATSGEEEGLKARIRQLEDKLRRYQDAKDEIRSLEAKLRHYGEAKDGP